MAKLKEYICPRSFECETSICTHRRVHEYTSSCDTECVGHGHSETCHPMSKSSRTRTPTVVRYVNLEEFQNNIGDVSSFLTSDHKTKYYTHKITMTVTIPATCPTCGIEIKEGMK